MLPHHPEILERTYYDNEMLRKWQVVEDERSGGGARGSIVDFQVAMVLLRALYLHMNVAKSKL